MPGKTLHHLRIISISALGLVLGGCAISTPFKGPGFADGRVKDSAPDARVVVSFTYAKVNDEQRAVFFDHVDRVVKSLPAQSGLIGYSIRRELLGDQVWTMTVWRSEEDRARFVLAQTHAEAMRAGMPALMAVRFARTEWPADQVPPSWKKAEDLLEKQGRSY
jgi:heme-degrading monooxygenase HmoA